MSAETARLNGWNFFMLLFTTTVNVELMLKIVLLLLSIGYTAWKWYRDAHKKNDP